MNLSTRFHKRGFTLLEVMIASGLFLLLSLLVARAFDTTQRMYTRLSGSSRELGCAALALDKLQDLCFGLPSEAIMQLPLPDGEILAVQRLERLAPSGEPVYSTDREVFESGSAGVVRRRLVDQGRDFGFSLQSLPESDSGRLHIFLEKGWTLHSEFKDGRFPLILEVRSPGPNQRLFQRVVPGYL